jgi:rubrerythrin
MANAAMEREGAHERMVESCRKSGDERLIKINEEFVEQSAEEIQILELILKYAQKQAYSR